jgi:LCP family protein required for cell wall assembly
MHMSDFAPGDEPGPAPVPAQAPRRRLLPKILIAVAALLVVALVGGSVYAYTINRSVTKNISRQDNLPADSGATPRPARDPQVTGALNYVVLGSDSRDPVNSGNGRSDSIMVVHLNDKRNKAYIISFPRDMYVEIPGHGKNKINAAFSLGGAKLTVSTLENLLDVRMDHVALIDFEGFVKLTESLGGVEVKNTTAFTSHGYTYPKGTISIKGEEALWFVRERHHLPGGDLARAANQRNVLKAIIEKGLSRTTMADPVRYLSFVSGLAQHVTVDKSLTDSEIRKTALSVNVKADDVQLLQAPLSGFGMTSDGQSIDIVNQKRLKALASALKKDKMGTYVEKYPKG